MSCFLSVNAVFKFVDELDVTDFVPLKITESVDPVSSLLAHDPTEHGACAYVCLPMAVIRQMACQ